LARFAGVAFSRRLKPQTMPYYVAIAGEKRGPYPAYRVIDLLRGGEIPPDALGWEQGMDAWLKLREIPAFIEVVEEMETKSESPEAESSRKAPVARAAPPALPVPEPPAGGIVAEKKPSTLSASFSETRPITHFWARIFDYSVVLTVAWQFCDVPALPKDVSPWDLMKNDGSIISQDALVKMAGIHYAALLIWMFVEGMLLHVWGTTPGKALFGIRLSGQDGERLSLTRGLGRSVLVWMAGFGFGLFPFYIIGALVGLGMLLFGGSTFWDRKFGVQVHHLPMTPARLILAVGGFFLLMVLSSLKFS